MAEKIKDCPFCGGNASVSKKYSDGYNWTSVVCHMCGAQSNGQNSLNKDAEEMAVKKWNHRPQIKEAKLTTSNTTKVQICPKCKGDGETWDGHSPRVDKCSKCGGSGKL